jgi:hypothetical protein
LWEQSYEVFTSFAGCLVGLASVVQGADQCPVLARKNAIKIASECLADPRCPSACRPQASPVLAMALHQAGHAEEVRAALQAAEQDLGRGWFSDTHKVLESNWHDWLMGHLLLREARSLIEGTSPVAPRVQ